MLQVWTSCENQTVLQCLKHHRCFSVWNIIEFTCFQIPLGKKCFIFIRIFLRTKYGIFPRSSYQRDLLLLVSAKRKTFYTIILAVKFYCGGKKNIFSVEFLLPWNKKLWKKTLKKKNQTKKATSLWKCAILSMFLAKKVTCNILKN